MSLAAGAEGKFTLVIFTFSMRTMRVFLSTSVWASIQATPNVAFLDPLAWTATAARTLSSSPCQESTCGW